MRNREVSPAIGAFCGMVICMLSIVITIRFLFWLGAR
jgi:hypothetical protein